MSAPTPPPGGWVECALCQRNPAPSDLGGTWYLLLPRRRYATISAGGGRPKRITTVRACPQCAVDFAAKDYPAIIERHERVYLPVPRHERAAAVAVLAQLRRQLVETAVPIPIPSTLEGQPS